MQGWGRQLEWWGSGMMSVLHWRECYPALLLALLVVPALELLGVPAAALLVVLALALLGVPAAVLLS